MIKKKLRNKKQIFINGMMMFNLIGNDMEFNTVDEGNRRANPH